jgi:amino acid permease
MTRRVHLQIDGIVVAASSPSSSGSDGGGDGPFQDGPSSSPSSPSSASSSSTSSFADDGGCGGGGGLDRDATTTSSSSPSAHAGEGTPLILLLPSSDGVNPRFRRRKRRPGTSEGGGGVDAAVAPSSGGGAGDASALRTSLNVAKFCMGTGTLALPFASEKGGLAFNALGLFLIAAWDYRMSLLLLGCHDLLPLAEEEEEGEEEGECEDDGGGRRSPSSSTANARGDGGARGSRGADDAAAPGGGRTTRARPSRGAGPARPPPPAAPPPPGTTAYGRVAWYALGPGGLMVLDALMLSLLLGLVVAYESAMASFLGGTPLTTGSGGLDLLVPNFVVVVLSCAPDVGRLGNFSGIGLMALAVSFVVISWQGFAENGCGGFRDAPSLGLRPASLAAASSWFGVAVFSYGVAPFVFNFRDSMGDPRDVGRAVRAGLLAVYVGYVAMSNGIRVLFSPSHVFDGDVLRAMPDSWISLSVRLLMTLMVALTTPLVVVPCGELIEGKLGMADGGDDGDGDEDDGRHRRRRSYLAPERVIVRVLICLSCAAFSEYVPNGFVDLVSFIGCFCGATTGFVLPPLFRLKLSTDGMPWSRGSMDGERMHDVGALVLAVIATSITSVLTFRELIGKIATE